MKEDIFGRQARTCLMCFTRGKRNVPSTMVSSDATGLQWLECADHGPRDNIGKVERVSTMPIDEWLAEQDLPPIGEDQ